MSEPLKDRRGKNCGVSYMTENELHYPMAQSRRDTLIGKNNPGSKAATKGGDNLAQCRAETPSTQGTISREGCEEHELHP